MTDLRNKILSNCLLRSFERKNIQKTKKTNTIKHEML